MQAQEQSVCVCYFPALVLLILCDHKLLFLHGPQRTSNHFVEANGFPTKE